MFIYTYSRIYKIAALPVALVVPADRVLRSAIPRRNLILRYSDRGSMLRYPYQVNLVKAQNRVLSIKIMKYLSY